MHTVSIRNVPIGPAAPLAIIAGPCVAESLDICLHVASELRARCAELALGFIFKASFDKANRSSVKSYRGPGIDDGLRILEAVRERFDVPVVTDIHETAQAAPVGAVVDLLQVPAFLCRQTDLLVAAGMTGKPVNVKKGQFMSPAEMANVAAKVVEGWAESQKSEVRGQKGRQVGDQKPEIRNQNPKFPGVILTDRGTFFGYNRLVNDFVGLGDLMELGWPVCFDVTHSTQQPGGQGTASGGRPERAPLLARAATAAGVQALFIETHPDPASAKSDAASMLPLDRTLVLLGEVARLRAAMG